MNIAKIRKALATNHLALVVVGVTAAAGIYIATNASAFTGSTPGVIVSAKAQTCTPNIKTGYISHKALFVAPDTVVLGGQFSQWENCARNKVYNRANMVAYSASTGAVKSFKADTDKEVYALEKAPSTSYIYVGGLFKTINGVARTGLARVNASTGAVDPAFNAKLAGSVYDLQYCGGKLYVAGSFPQKLVALDPTTGADTGTIALSITGDLTTPSQAEAGPQRVDKISINPACTDLVAIGNFTTVNGVSRTLAFRINTGASAVLSNWHPQRFAPGCIIAYYLRNVEWSKDGTYFMVVSTGGPLGYPAAGFCDAAGRWEAASNDGIAEPTWVNWTGGDSLYSVAIDTPAHIAYVGGHNRWLDNPEGHDSAGPNAYPVDSIGAISTDTGLAIRTWDARPMTREHGKEDLVLFSGGLIEASDGHTVSGSYHYGTAIFPAK